MANEMKHLENLRPTDDVTEEAMRILRAKRIRQAIGMALSEQVNIEGTMLDLKEKQDMKYIIGEYPGQLRIHSYNAAVRRKTGMTFKPHQTISYWRFNNPNNMEYQKLMEPDCPIRYYAQFREGNDSMFYDLLILNMDVFRKAIIPWLETMPKKETWSKSQYFPGVGMVNLRSRWHGATQEWFYGIEKPADNSELLIYYELLPGVEAVAPPVLPSITNQQAAFQF